jgi:hypothetical protein
MRSSVRIQDLKPVNAREELLIQMLAEAGLSENPLSLGPLFGLLLIFVLIGLLAYLLLQRIAEFLIGRTETSVRELLFYTAVVALLCALMSLVWNLRSMPN